MLCNYVLIGGWSIAEESYIIHGFYYYVFWYFISLHRSMLQFYIDLFTHSKFDQPSHQYVDRVCCRKLPPPLTGRKLVPRQINSEANATRCQSKRDTHHTCQPNSRTPFKIQRTSRGRAGALSARHRWARPRPGAPGVAPLPAAPGPARRPAAASVSRVWTFIDSSCTKFAAG